MTRGKMRVILVFPLLLATVLHILPAPASAAVSPGTTLRPTDPPTQAWSSPNNTFVIRFVPDPRSPSSLFRAAITLAAPSIPVWTAGGTGNTSASVDSAASLRFLTDGNLRLVNGSGSVVWESSTAGRGVTTADLQENGNLVLRNATSLVWQSFENPTDTILQNQNFTSGQVLRSGAYSFRVLPGSGNLTLRWNDNVVYYTKSPNSLNSSFSSNGTQLASPSLILQSNGILSLNDLSLPSAPVIAYSSDYGEGGDTNLVRYVRLDNDGNIRAYSMVRGSTAPQETPRWSAVEDQCEVFGWCGNYGMCSYNDTQAVCGCPSGNFVPVDPNNPRAGCRRTREIQDCPGNSTMLELDNTKFLTYVPDLSAELFFVGISACRLNCLSGASCVASTSLADGSGLCYLKVSNFISGYQSRALPSTSYVKVCAPGIPNPPLAAGSGPSQNGGSSKELRWWVVLLVVLGTIAGLVLIEYALWWCFCKGNAKYGVGGATSAQYALLEYASGAPVQFSYKELHRSTKGFKERLGAGGFGAVYKGTLQANRTVVAVKQLEGIEQGEKQFRMEVATISSTHHLNLVRLIGFCSEGRHRLLVYEFMKNGSLDNFLFPATPSDGSAPKAPPPLPWDARYRIALGTARGITYLHEECRDCIVHCDIKPENILLDDGFNAKVSDFGLAKLVNPKDHRYRTLTSVRGTRGYLAPEWLANLPITSKSDVYSFGMVLLEIVSGRRNFDISEETGRKKFSVWAYEEFDRGSVQTIVDRKISVQDVDMAQLERAVQVSFWCIQEQPSQRPSMGKVVQMLEGVMDIERPPAPKAIDASVSITSGSASASILSTFAPSALVQSSTDSFQGGDGGAAKSSTTSASRRNGEKTSSTLLTQ